MSVDSTTSSKTDCTFLFADIAGFTALTEAHGDEDAADLALDFSRRVRDVLPSDEGEVVKTIGDALMARLFTARFAVGLGSLIAHDLMADHGQPTVRVGMHTGPSSERDGDYFGATVNLAARIAAAAAGGEVFVSEKVRAAAGDMADTTFVPRGTHSLRNISTPVVLYSVERATGELRPARVLDPVCHMTITPSRETSRAVVDGTVYLFCSETCAALFAQSPERYVREDS